jgi:dTDP-4-amino-4,6-dideoxygalactose transaminase
VSDRYPQPVAEQPTLQEIPFADLSGLHAPFKEDALAAFDALIERSEFGIGETVAAFEAAFARFCDVDECVGVSNGLDALRLLLQAAGVRPRDEVIVPAMTFIATFAAVSQLGATPVPVDVSWDDYCIDPAAIEAAVGSRTRVLLPVHLYGQLADMAAVAAVAGRLGLPIVEDACQAHGASRAGYTPARGTMGAAFSFYPGKNLGAMGDAGAVVTSDADIAEQVRTLRVHGERAKYRHERIGWTARLDAFQAAILTLKLQRLADWNLERRAIAGLYSELLDAAGDLALPPVAPQSEHVWHLYVVRTSDPAALADHLHARGIATGRHYPEPPHLTEALAPLGHAAGSFPVAEELARTGLSLPIFPGMTETQVEAVVAAVSDYFRKP